MELGSSREFHHAARWRACAEVCFRHREVRAFGDVILGALRARLDQNKIITHSLPVELLDVGWSYGLSISSRELADTLGRDPVEVPERLRRAMERAAESGRSSVWQWRVGQEISEAVECGWYTFFVTLTLDPTLVPDGEIFWKGPSFNRWVQALERLVRKASGVRSRERGGPKRADFFRYAAVLEHGKSGEHHHCHMLLACPVVPESWLVDPNWRGTTHFTNIDGAAATWPYGRIVKFEPFWTAGCRWAETHVQPVGRTIYSPWTAGAYLFSYVEKGRKKWSHRVRCTQGFGLRAMRQVVTALPWAHLRTATLMPGLMTRLKWFEGFGPPLSMMRQCAKLERFRRSRAFGSQWDPLMMRVMLRSAKPFVALLEAFLECPEMDVNCSRQRYACVLSAYPPEQIGSCDVFGPLLDWMREAGLCRDRHQQGSENVAIPKRGVFGW